MMQGMATRDTRTRYQGVYARHQERCALSTRGGDRCTCKPSYWGKAYDRARRRPVRTRRFASAEAARNARADLQASLDRGEAPATTRSLRLVDARQRFVAAAREGRALNKHGRRYKPRAIDNIEEVLRVHVEPVLGRRRITDTRRGDVQEIVDTLAPELSGSRVRAVVNSLRALYRWAQDRDLAQHDPAQHVRLPAMAAQPVERVASPAEFAALLDALPLEDALPYALAGYGMGRRQQVVLLRWREVDLAVDAIEWGVEWEAAKYEASRRVVPCVPPLNTLLRRAFIAQGRPDGWARVCPPRYERASVLSSSGLAQRARGRWARAGLRPITLQQCRHSAATWLDAAGVSPKVSSVLMGHSTPQRQPGAAQITLERYTHALPEDIERARRQLADYLAAGQAHREAR
jgi:integrase